MHIPYARSINPVSGTNLEDQEKKGVQPDLVVKSEEALSIAIQHLNKTMTHEPTNNLNSNTRILKELNVQQYQDITNKRKANCNAE